MIVQEKDGGLLLFRQTDHALLSGEFAAAWGNDVIPAPARREQTLIAASRHDDGWAEWELAPKLRPDGDPVDFIRVPVSDHVPLYKRGIDLVAGEDDYAGLVASMHGERLYTRPFHPGMDPRIEHLQGDDLDRAKRYVDGEHERQARLLERLGDGAAADAHEGWRLLQVWDRLSLLVCMSPIGPQAAQTFPPIASANGDVQITARGNEAGELVLDPYPFAQDGAIFDISLVHTAAKRWPDVDSYRRDFRVAPHEVLSFRCVTP
jgi:uncharacterized protein DUF3891